MIRALTFDDVNIKPKYSEVKTRSVVNLTSRFTKNTKLSVPIVSSPIDTITEYDMAKEMMRLGGVGVVHRFMSIEKQANIISQLHVNREDNTIPICAAIGVTADYIERAEYLIDNGCDVLLIDVAHGHHKLVKEALRRLHNEVKGTFEIIAGSIATEEAARDLCEWGASGLRVGVGNGCFTPEMEVITTYGNKKIEDIKLGDKVISHDGTINKVIDKFEYDRDEEIMEINEIECTKNHKFYVVHKKYENIVNENNIEEYAEWVKAEELNNNYLLINVSKN